ncbi:MAG: hypothetical protein EOQ45_32055 [Mesorhizobium sp.]|uniref:hypothetical protein n=1 Tax=Mesorhizobium sp. TaxID=1871066 RepID=UPI000FE6A501|nr:hypothetical protein [Mesorhizobium sp.]RWF88529.1 MAG: hypothetical protein EOQ45_32055 [Mesorhizobium sp.]
MSGQKDTLSISWAFPWDWKRIRSLASSDRTADTWADVYDSVLSERLKYRYLEPITRMDANGKGEGFSILTIQCALIEFLASLRKGWSYRHGHKDYGKDDAYGDSQKLYVDFLRKEEPFKAHFTKRQAEGFYADIRCGLVHEAQTKRGWRIWRGDASQPVIDHTRKIVYRESMRRCITDYLERYRSELLLSTDLQDAFIRKFDYLHKHTEKPAP